MNFKYVVCYPAKSNQNVDNKFLLVGDKFLLLDLETVCVVNLVLDATLFDTPGEANAWCLDLPVDDELHDNACVVCVELAVISQTRTTNE
jgi:hypothetical protein